LVFDRAFEKKQFRSLDAIQEEKDEHGYGVAA